MVKHENGYSGEFIGETGLVIYNKQGYEVMKSNYRQINTEKELYKFLAEFPAYEKVLKMKEM